MAVTEDSSTRSVAVHCAIVCASSAWAGHPDMITGTVCDWLMAVTMVGFKAGGHDWR